jgi:hypothetical protein
LKKYFMLTPKNHLNLKPKKNVVIKSVPTVRLDGVGSRRKILKSEDGKIVAKKILVNKKLDREEVSDVRPKTSVDESRRNFLKVAGVAGLGLAATTLLPKGAEAYVAGSTPTSNVVGVKDSANARINPAEEDGNLATIKTNTDPLVASGAGGYIRQDSNATIAKESGGNLATIATNIPAQGQATMAGSTPVVIASNQTAIPVSGSFSIDAVGINDKNGTRVTPATDDSILYLRRIVKLMESQAVVDSGNRQRITLDSLGTGTLITTTVPVSGSLTTAGTVSTVSTVSAITTSLGQNQQAFQDVARNAYANGIRNNLNFT